MHDIQQIFSSSWNLNIFKAPPNAKDAKPVTNLSSDAVNAWLPNQAPSSNVAADMLCRNKQYSFKPATAST